MTVFNVYFILALATKTHTIQQIPQILAKRTLNL